MIMRDLSVRWVVLAATVVIATMFVDYASAGTYANITVQGEPAGTEFNDWAGIPVLAMDPLDNPGDQFVDIKDVQIANNDEFLFVHISYHTTKSTGTYIAIDNDQNVATGYDIFGLGLIGSEIGYVNDFPFSQTNGIFNTNVSLTGGPLGNGGALIYPFWDQDGLDKELAIPLELAVSFPAGPGFPNPFMDVMIYSIDGLADITDVISYTLAEVPEVPGDYNKNGTVDAADYVVWRESDGSQAGYDLWRANFGDMAGAGVGSGSERSATLAAVPEPASGLMLGLVAAALFVFRRRCGPAL